MPKKSVNMKDLAALTAKTGVEYAMFTKGAERLIVRGDARSVYITEKMAEELSLLGYRWSGHTHPGEGMFVKTASDGDRAILAAFEQSQSVIYDQYGKYQVFGIGW